MSATTLKERRRKTNADQRWIVPGFEWRSS
jgi:hypothetical protein